MIVERTPVLGRCLVMVVPCLMGIWAGLGKLLGPGLLGSQYRVHLWREKKASIPDVPRSAGP